jgi:hypothetical protein
VKELNKLFGIARAVSIDECDLEAKGYEAATKGATTDNCHFGFFATIESRDEWQRGYDRGILERASAKGETT